MEENMPLVSVIVPCYNHEKYIEQTIESIVNQTYENIELIVIDDGSKDNSVKVIQALVDKYNFIFIHRPNKGLSVTLNEAILLSNGKYLNVCASDDILVLDKIDKQVKFMEKHTEYGMCYSNVYVFTDDGKITPRKIENSKDGWVFNEIFNAEFYMQAVSCFYQKNVFIAIGGFDENLKVEDMDFHLRLTFKYQVGYLDDFLAYYRLHENSATSNRIMILQEVIKILDKWEQYPGYQYAKKKHLLLHFHGLVVEEKAEAFKLLPTLIPFCLKKELWKSILLLFLPKKTISFIRIRRKKYD